MKTSSKKWQKIRKIKGLRQFVTWYPRHVSENPGGMPERKQQLIEEIIKISADIICLQEVPNKAAHQDLVERCRYQFAVFHEHANEEEGLSILSRYSIKSFEYDQNCIFAKIEIQNKTLLLINTHLPWDSAVNRELVV